jgi:hypothetical protein
VQEPDLIELFLAPLKAAGIDRYMVSGSVAAIEFGEPRATLDVDVALFIEQEAVGGLLAAFPEPEYYCPPRDVIASEIARPSRGHFNVIHLSSGLKADFYPSRNHPLFGWAFENRRSLPLSGHDVWFAPPEYVILWKLEFFREGAGEKHLRDIRGMLAVSTGEMNLDFLTEWADKLCLNSFWRKCHPPQTAASNAEH